MFVLNTSKGSTGKSLNPIRNGKLSRIYSFKPHHNIRKWPYYYHSCFIDEGNEVQGGKITCQGHRASNWWHWDLNPSCRGHTLTLPLDHYDDLFWDQIRPKNKKGRWKENINDFAWLTVASGQSENSKKWLFTSLLITSLLGTLLYLY